MFVKSFSINFICLMLGVAEAHAESLSLDLFVSQSLVSDPIVAENKGSLEAVQYEAQALKNSVILPRLRISSALGPAPGITQKVDSVWANGAKVAQIRQEYDFSSLGPYFGSELEFAQPLNLNRLRLGLKALKAKSTVKEYEINQFIADRSAFYQESYFQYQFALSMKTLLKEVEAELQKHQVELQAKSDSGDTDASQALLEIEANSFELSEGLYKVDEGLNRAERGFKFLLGDTSTLIQLSDTLLSPRMDSLYDLDTYQREYLQESLELKQLKAGLQAKRTVTELKKNEMGPEFFVFGTLKFAKSWARDRESTTGDVFQQDPLNHFDASLGVGARLDLNFWSKYSALRNAEIDQKQLERKEKYAQSGLLVQFGDLYQQLALNKKRYLAAEKAMNASDALVTNAAALFDVDPTQGSKLLSAYKTHISNRKTYYNTVLDYNISFAKLIAKMGLTLSQFKAKFPTITHKES